MNNRLSWEEYAIGLAEAASLRSEDPYVKVGAAVFRDDWSVAGVVITVLLLALTLIGQIEMIDAGGLSMQR